MDFFSNRIGKFRKRLEKRIIKRGDGKRIASHGIAVSEETPPIPPAKTQAFQPTVEPPSRVDLRKFCSPVEDQSQSNSCCANAAVGAYEYLCVREAAATGDTPGDVSRLFVYYVGRLRDKQLWNDKTPIADEGITLTGAIDALTMKGACLAESWPFDLDNINSKPPENTFDEAMSYKISSSKQIPTDVESMKACLAEGYPIIFGLKLTKAFFSGGNNGYIQTPNPDDPKSAEHGLHAMLIVGYSEKTQTFIVRNSWGEDWADKGYCYLPYDYAANPDFNFLGQYAICGLTETDFTPDDEDDDEDLFNEGEDYNDDDDVESETEELEEGAEEEEDSDMFDQHAEAHKVFAKFDVDGSGSLDVREVSAALRLMGTRVRPFQLQMLMRRFDEDGSGTLSFEEFIALPGVMALESS